MTGARVLSLVLGLAATLGAQVSNDTCAAAIAITGSVVSGTNVGATTGPDPVPSCQTMTGDVWYSWVAPCTGTYAASTCGAATTFGTIVSVWSAPGGCGTLTEIACSDLCASGPYQGATATFTSVTGVTYYISVGGNSGTSGMFSLSLSLGAGMTFSFVNAGPGTIGYLISEGPSNGTAFVAVTLTAGQFPVGWFLGIDIAWLDLINQLAIGFPFVIPLQSCGSAAFGPVGGLPPGLHLYGVCVALPPSGTVPSAFTVPALGVVP